LSLRWDKSSQELVHHLLDFTAAKSIIVSIPHYLSTENLKEVIEHIQHFLEHTVDEAKEKLEEVVNQAKDKLAKVKEMLEPLIAKAVEHSGANSEKLKGLLAELTTFTHHGKVPFINKSHISLTPAQRHRHLHAMARANTHGLLCVSFADSLCTCAFFPGGRVGQQDCRACACREGQGPHVGRPG
jgi:ElaB/YqjD/DUF883 family membrane-anchored ribosome-binding protein